MCPRTARFEVALLSLAAAGASDTSGATVDVLQTLKFGAGHSQARPGAAGASLLD